MERRVVVTGLGILSPIGNSPEEISNSLRQSYSGVVVMEEWKEVQSLRCFVAGQVKSVDAARLPRSIRRTCGRASIMAALATEDAILDAGLSRDDVRSPRVGLAMASTTGSQIALEDFFRQYAKIGLSQQKGTTFMKVMGHTIASNVALHLGIRGRMFSPTSACTSSSQSFGLAYEQIKYGLQDVMIAGGAEELHPLSAGSFDLLDAAARGGEEDSSKASRPFDSKRSGLVVAEGAAVLILEERDRALERGANIYAEVVSYDTCSSASHMTAPSGESMSRCMRGALLAAKMSAGEIEYINAHATATLLGDAAEAKSVLDVFGGDVRVSSTKGHTGHMLGASGAAELIFLVRMMRDGFVAPTLNLDEVSEDCKGLNYLRTPIDAELSLVMSNNFAFGGVNTSIILSSKIKS